MNFEHYKNLLLEFKEILFEKVGENLVSIVLYGSVARKDAKKTSDIDLLIILEYEKDYFNMLKPLMDSFKELKKKEVYKKFLKKGIKPYLSFLVFSKKEALKNRWIYLDMLEDAIIIYDKNKFFEKKIKEFERKLKKFGSRKVKLPDGRWYWEIKPSLKAGEIFEI